MPKEKSPGSPTTRRYSDGEKADAVRLVRQLRKELGSEHGTVQRVADQLGYGLESVRGSAKPTLRTPGWSRRPAGPPARGREQGARPGAARDPPSERDLAQGG